LDLNCGVSLRGLFFDIVSSFRSGGPALR
jgi:hypothetical protein